MKTPILGSAYVARSVNAADNRMVNLFPEIIPEGGKEPAFLNRAPGLRLLVAAGSGPVRGMQTVGAFLYVVSGNKLYKVDTAYTATELGTLAASSGPVSLSDNGTQLFIANGATGYIYNTSTAAFTQITDADFPGAGSVGFVDGYFVFNQPDSRKVWVTALWDGTLIDGTDYEESSGITGNVVAIFTDHREVWVFGSDNIEVWYNAGGADFPLASIQGAFLEMGCASAYSIAKLDNGIFWLGRDARGQGIVYRANGYTGQRVSTHAIEWQIQQYGDISDAIAYTYQQDGHSFYVLTFPTADATWVYDVATQAWHERAGFAAGEFTRHRGNCQAFFNSENVIGDYQNGNLYAFDLDVYADNGSIQKWLRSWRALPPERNNLKRSAHHSLQLDCETGTGTASTARTATKSTNNSGTGTLVVANGADTGTFDLDLVVTDSGSRTASKATNNTGVPGALTVTVATGTTTYDLDLVISDSNTRTASKSTNNTSTSLVSVSDGAIAGSYNLVVSKSATSYSTDRIPTMTGATTSGVTMSASTEQDASKAAWKAGDSSNTTVWQVASGTTGWLQVQFAAAKTITRYTIIAGEGAGFTANNAPKAWTLYGSATGAFAGEQVAVDAQTGQLAWSGAGSNTYDCATPASYLYYRLDITEGVGGALLIGDLALIESVRDWQFTWNGTLGNVSYGSTWADVVAAGNQAISGGVAGLLTFTPTGSEPSDQGTDSVTVAVVPYYRYRYGPSDSETWEPSAARAFPASTEITITTGGAAGTLVFTTDSSAPSTSLQTLTDVVTLTLVPYYRFQYDDVWETTAAHAWTAGTITVGNLTFTKDGSAPTSTVGTYTDTVTVAGGTTDPQVMLRWSDDGGHTWSNEHWVSMGATGNYGQRAIWRRLGMTMKIRDRVYEVSGTDPVKVSILGAELQASGTNA